MNTEQFKRRLTAILSADVAGYSRLMGEDEESTVRTLTAYREVISGLIHQHRGRVVDSPGDNILAEFPSVVDAIQGSISIQKELSARNAELPENRRMQFRIGINIGDVIQEGDRIYGDGVNIAARLEALADPGGICISRMAYDQIESKLPLGYEYLGEQVVKNISKPLHAYRVIIDPEKESQQKGEPEGSDSKSRHRHSKREYSGDHLEQSFQKAKSRLKDFSREMKEDEQLGETFKEIKGRVGTFADEMRGSPERRRRALHNLIQVKHLRFFLGVAAALFLINAFTSFGHWWFLYPLLSIGLVVYLHWLKTSFFSPEKVKQMRRQLHQKEFSRLNGGDSEEGRERADKMAHARIRFYNHLYTYLGVNAFLLLINLLTNPFNLWFHFPLLGWGIMVFLHWMKLK
ncbi:adenylate/guanylate cyclase domain-containing protein [Thermodesulfobacteriota bacterium]